MGRVVFVFKLSLKQRVLPSIFSECHRRKTAERFLEFVGLLIE